MPDDTYSMEYTGQQLDEALDKVTEDYADVSAVTAVPADVRAGVTFVDHNRVLQVGTAAQGGGVSWYGVCSTASTTSTKSVIIEGFPTAYTDGLSLCVLFTNTQQATGTITLSINGETAIPLNSDLNTGVGINAWKSGEVIEFIYDSSANSNSGAFIIVTDGSNSSSGGNINSIESQKGIVVNVMDGAFGQQVDNIRTYVDLYQTRDEGASTIPSPDNIRPLTIRRLPYYHYAAGKNLLVKHEEGEHTVTGSGGDTGSVTFHFNADGSVTVTGNTDTQSLSTQYLYQEWVKHIPTGVYIIASGGTDNVYIHLRYTNAANQGAIVAISKQGNEVKYMYSAGLRATSVRLYVPAGKSNINETIYPMIRLASDDDSTWESPSGHFFSVNVSDGIYGGYIDFKSNTVVNTYDKYSYNGTEDSWVVSDTNVETLKAFSIPVSGLKYYDNTADNLYGMCNMFDKGSVDISNVSKDTWWYYYDGANTSLTFIWEPVGTGDNDLAKWKSFLGGMYADSTPLEICLPLSTPISSSNVTIPALPILSDYNTYWFDAGDIEVSYPLDLVKYINKVTDTSDIKSNLIDYNSYDILTGKEFNDGTFTDIEFTWTGHTCYVNGTTTKTRTNLILGSFTSPYLPEEIIAGNTYFVKYHGENVYLQVLVWNEVGSSAITIARIYDDQIVTIPSSAIAVCFRLVVAGTSSNPVTVDEEYVSVAILNAESNKGLFDALTNQDSRYAWQKPDFLIHIPQEETSDMLEVVYDYIGKSLLSTEDWVESTNAVNPGTSTYKLVRKVSSSDIYDMWDELQSRYPDYIDEGEVIGYSLDIPDAETGVQPNYRAIKAYYIHPRQTYTKSGKTYSIRYSDMPTIYLTAGTHGGESTPTWNLFSIFRRAFLTGTIYSEFLHSTCFRVVPCLDCWNYDHWTRYLAAAYIGYNESGELIQNPDINIDDYDGNRQCICSSSSSISYDALNLHEYATEAKALTDYLDTCGFGSVYGDCYIDLHNNSNSLGYLTTGNEVISNLYNTMMDTLAKDWLVNTTWANGWPANYYSSNTASATTLSGKILARASVATSYAWFFENAYNCFSSNILEVQQSGPGAGNEYAIAKGLDMTYRWLKVLHNNINHDGQEDSIADFYVEETIEGNPIFFGDKWSVVDDVKIPIDYVQIGEGVPSPSNPRTIYTCREVIVSSKNILSPINTTVDGDTTFTANEDGSITIDSGGVAAAANRSKILPDNGDGNRRFRIPTDTYLYLSGSIPNVRLEVCYQWDNPNDTTTIKYLRTTTAGKTADGVIVTNEDLATESQYSTGGYPFITGGYFILPSQILSNGEYYNVTTAYLKLVITSGLVYDNVTVYPMLQPVPAPNQGASLVFEKGLPPVAIKSLFDSLPYTGGFGTYDYISGEFSIDKLLITFDGSSDEEWQIYDGTTKSGLICFQLQVNSPLVGWSNISEFKGVSNIFKVGNGNVASSSAEANTWWYTRNAGTSSSGMGYYNFVMSSSDVSTVDAWRSWLDTNHTQIVVPLETQIVYQLTDKKDSVQINLDRLITRFSFGAYDYYVWDKEFSAHAWASSASGREITPGTPIISPIVDNTLSIYGQAADAKIVGDKLEGLQWGNGKTIECFTTDDTTSRVTTFDGVIALYDELVSKYPSYVTKNTLSYNNTTLYEYVFTTGAYNDYVVSGTLRDENPKIIKPVILMTAGVHGNEQASVMGLYDFIKNLCKNNFKLMSIRDGITLKVVPIVSPSGYNQNTRVNVNSVNINRNFDANWNPEAIGGDKNNPGQSAADQDETQIVQAWLQNNKDALLYIDSHNASGGNEVSFFLGNQETASIAVKNMYLKAMDKIIPYWERVRKIPSSVRFALTGGFNPGNFTIGGSATEYGRSQGILSFTIETSWNINETGLCSNYTIGVVSEALANLLLEIVSSLKLTGNSFITDNDVSILVFGTSFSYSTLGYLPRILKDLNPSINLTLGILYRSGASVQDHIDLFSTDTAYTEYSEYDFCSEKWINVDSTITAKNALDIRKWDYICIQQGWAATIADFNTLSEMIMNYVDYPFSFLVNMPQANGAGCYNPPSEEQSDTMFNLIAQNAENLKDSYIASDVIPGGTAVQNARHIESLKNIGTYGYLCDDTIGHLQNGLGPLVSGYAASYKLLELIGKKQKMYCQPWNPTDSYLGSSNYNLWTATSHGSCVGVTDANKLLAQKCALAAIKDPFNITTIPINTIVISAQPSSTSVASGASVTFSVTATGDNLSYRWQYSDTGIIWSAASGTSSSFTFTASSSFNGRKYRCKVYNDNFDVFSDEATLTVT